MVKDGFHYMKLEQPQSIRTIFFDAGFTLLYPYPSIAAVCQSVCERMQLTIHLEQLEEGIRTAEDFYFRLSRTNRHTWADEQAINDFWIDYYASLMRPLLSEQNEPRLYELAMAINDEFSKHTNWQLYEDVLPTLEKLRAQGYSLGVISDWGLALGPILRQLRLTHYFDCLVISAANRYAKPAPQLYETALQRANAISDYTVHIGDSYLHDVLGARSVGITPILLDRPRRLFKQQVDCLLVHSLDELLDLLEVAV